MLGLCAPVPTLPAMRREINCETLWTWARNLRGAWNWNRLHLRSSFLQPISIRMVVQYRLIPLEKSAVRSVARGCMGMNDEWTQTRNELLYQTKVAGAPLCTNTAWSLCGLTPPAKGIKLFGDPHAHTNDVPKHWRSTFLFLTAVNAAEVGTAWNQIFPRRRWLEEIWKPVLEHTSYFQAVRTP